MAMFEIETEEGRDVHQVLGNDGCFARSRIIGRVIEPPICSGYCPNECEHYSSNPGCRLYKGFKKKDLNRRSEEKTQK